MRDHILVVDDEIGMRAALEVSLRRAGWRVETATGAEDGIRRFVSGRHDLVITDMRLLDGDGLQVMREVRKLRPATPVMLLTAYGSIPGAVQAMKAGACDYLIKPVATEHLRDRVSGLLQAVVASQGEMQIIGDSPALLRALEDAARAARTSADILVEAESGTGKELLARYIHERSRNHGGPFVAINCAAVPETLLESELFGHARGAFTGAITDKKGKFELADGGTLLLDEIGEMPLSLQPKLLRVLQERKMERLGDWQPISVNARVIATTNRTLSELVHENQFRADLYFRLNVIPLSLPPLRDRVDDIPKLAAHFARTMAEDSECVELTPEFLQMLQEYSWPGNVRELANVVRRAVALSPEKRIGPESLRERGGAPRRPIENADQLTRDEAERSLFRSTLLRMHGNRTRTAEALGVSVRTVRNKIRTYGLAGIPA